jgi:hypothetical protein
MTALEIAVKALERIAEFGDSDNTSCIALAAIATQQQATPSATIDSEEMRNLLCKWANIAISDDLFGEPDAWTAFVAHIDARIAAAGMADKPQWLPIESAPTDGAYVLVGNGSGAWIAKYCAVFQSGYRPDNPWQSMMLNHDHIRGGNRVPTHYMPLPAAPAMSQDQKGGL